MFKRMPMVYRLAAVALVALGVAISALLWAQRANAEEGDPRPTTSLILSKDLPQDTCQASAPCVWFRSPEHPEVYLMLELMADTAKCDVAYTRFNLEVDGIDIDSTWFNQVNNLIAQHGFPTEIPDTLVQYIQSVRFHRSPHHGNWSVEMLYIDRIWYVSIMNSPYYPVIFLDRIRKAGLLD